MEGSGQGSPQLLDTAADQVAGVVERVVYSDAGSSWSVLRVRPGDALPSDWLTVVGTAPMAYEGAVIRAWGSWRDDPSWGRQFVARRIELEAASEAQSIEAYLASGIVKGLGKRLARRLIKAFGDDVLRIIAELPERLAGVPGIDAELQQKIVATIGRQRSLRELVLFLTAHGIPAARATRILDAYGAKALDRIRRNPWSLALDVKGIGFRGADELARQMGIGGNSPERLAAALVHVLSEATATGDAGLPLGEAVLRLQALTECTVEAAEATVASVGRSGHIAVEPHEPTAIVMLAPLREAEIAIATGLARLAATALPWRATDVDRARSDAETSLGHGLAASQRVALAAMLATKVMVVTGGPGTGKTTLIRGLLAALPADVLRIQLAAPTGRAAKRLAESTGEEARTLHRLLEAEPGRGFRRGRERPLACDLMVVDEMSMVDLSLMAALVEALPDEAALLMVGDADQLPSVGPGQVLADLVASEAYPVLRLTEIFRQAEGSGIIANAHRINGGEAPAFARADEDGDFYGVRVDDPEDAQTKLVELVAARIPERFGLDPVEDVQVLCPVNRGPLGTRELNRLLQARLNPEPEAVHMRGETRFGVGDKVMQIENDYSREVWNGDIGHVTAVRARSRQLEVEIDGRPLLYPFDELDQLVPAFAITVHKAQGSEYPAVVIPLSRSHGRMLQRRLLYTAVSRAKKLVVLLAEPAALERAVQGRADRPRVSLLAERLRRTKEQA